MPTLTADIGLLADPDDSPAGFDWQITGWPDTAGGNGRALIGGVAGPTGTLDANGRALIDLPASLDGTWYVFTVPAIERSWPFQMPDHDSDLGTEFNRYDPVTGTRFERGETGPPGGYAYFAALDFDFPPLDLPTAKADAWTVQLGSQQFPGGILAATPFLSSYSGFVYFDTDTTAQYDFALRIHHQIGDVGFLIERHVNRRVVKAETFTLYMSAFDSESQVRIGPYLDANGDIIEITEGMLDAPVTCTFELEVTAQKDFSVEEASISQAKAWFSQQAIGVGGLEPLPGTPGVGIADITEDATGRLTVTLTNRRTVGPFTLPQGPQGASVYDIYKVVPDNAVPTDAPTGGSFTTTTQVLVPPDGWSLSPSDPGDGEVLVASRAEINPVGQGTTIVPDWSVPFTAGSHGPPGTPGKQGPQGISHLTVWRKQADGTTPATPGHTTWTLDANGNITFVAPDNWAGAPPDPPTLLEPNARIFSSVAEIDPNLGVGTHTALWLAPVPATGRRGQKGDDGGDGTPGTRGSLWYSGPGAPITRQPAGVRQDDWWLNTSNYDIWQYDEHSTWNRRGNIRGPSGDDPDLTVSAPLSGTGSPAAPLTVADAAIAGAKLADGAVTSGKLADSAVTSGKLADDAVTSGKLADDAVTAAAIADGSVSGSKLLDGVLEANPVTQSADPVLTGVTVKGQRYRNPGEATPTGGAGERTVLGVLAKADASANADLFEKTATISGLHHGELVTFVLSIAAESTSQNWAVFGSALTQGNVPTTDPTGSLAGTDWRRVGGQTFRDRDTPTLEVNRDNSSVVAVEAVWNGSDGASFDIKVGAVIRSLAATTSLTVTLAVIRAAQSTATVTTKSPVGGTGTPDDPLTVIPGTIHDVQLANASVGPGKLKPKATYQDSKTVLRGGDNVTVTPNDTTEQIVVAAQQSGRPIAPGPESSFWGRAVGQSDPVAVPLKLRAIDSHDQRDIQGAYGYVPGGGTIADQDFAAQSGDADSDFTRWNMSNFGDNPGAYDAARPGLLIDRGDNQLNPNGVDFTNATAGTTQRTMHLQLQFEPDNQRDYGSDEVLIVRVVRNGGSRVNVNTDQGGDAAKNIVAQHAWHFTGGNQAPFTFNFDLSYSAAPRHGATDGIGILFQYLPPSHQVVGLRGGLEVGVVLPALGSIPTQKLTAAAETAFRIPGDRRRGILGLDIPSNDDHTGRNAPGESDHADITHAAPAGWPANTAQPFMQAAQDLQQVRITMTGTIASQGAGGQVLLMHQSPAAGIGPTLLAAVAVDQTGPISLDHTQVGVLEGDQFWIAFSGTGLGTGTQTVTWDANLAGGKPILNTVIAGVIHTVSESMATDNQPGQQIRTHTWAASDYPALIEAARTGHLEELRIFSNGFDSAISLTSLIVPDGADPVNNASRSQPLTFGLYARSSQNGGSYQGRLGGNFWLDNTGLHVRFQSVGTQQPQVWAERIELDYLA